MPEGFDPSQMQMPEGMEMPEDFDFSQMGGMTPPEGMELPEGGMDFGGRGQGGADGAAAEQNAVLTVAEGGNQFGGISAYQSA